MELINIIFDVACFLLLISASANGQGDYYSGPAVPAVYQPPSEYNNPPAGFNNFNPGGLNNFNPGGFNNFNPGGLNNFNPGGLNNFNPGGLNNFNNPGGLYNFNNPAGSTGYSSPADSSRYNPPAGSTDYNNPPGGPSGYNPPADYVDYNPPAGSADYNPPPGSSGSNNPSAGSSPYVRNKNHRNRSRRPRFSTKRPVQSGSDGSIPTSNGKNSANPSNERSSSMRTQSKRRATKRPSGTHRETPTRSNPNCYRVPGHRMVCLFNNRHFWRGGFRPIMLDPCICDILNYEFAILDPKSYEMVPGEPDLDLEEDMFTEATDLKKENPELKVFLSLGGWDDSTKKYSEMADDPAKRQNFITKAIEFLLKHEFDGLDLAWEYPNCWQGAIGVSPKDKNNFVVLLKELRQEIDKNKLGLSISVGPVKREIEAAYNIPAIAPLVDHINVMTYDMHGPWEPVTGHHSQFNKLPRDEDPYCNVKAAMKFWAEKGAPRRKLNMGIAFYAKTFTMKSPDTCAMGVPADGIGEPGPVSQNGGFMLYNEMCQLLNDGNWTEYEDKEAGFYACSGDQFACYDPPMMVVEKAKWVVMEGFGGVLLKDLSGDDFTGGCFNLPFPLTKMCRLEMVQQIHKQEKKG